MCILSADALKADIGPPKDFCHRLKVMSGVDVMIIIFDNFRGKNKLAFFSKTNVMIKILHNLALY
jgi:hypothetical protein